MSSMEPSLGNWTGSSVRADTTVKRPTPMNKRETTQRVRPASRRRFLANPILIKIRIAEAGRVNVALI
jgi:hypothetical protein